MKHFASWFRRPTSCEYESSMSRDAIPQQEPQINLLLFVSTNTYFRSQYDLALALRDKGHVSIICFDQVYPQLSAHQRICHENGFLTLSKKAACRWAAVGLIRKALCQVAVVQEIASYQDTRLLLNRAVREIQPHCVILPAENRYRLSQIAKFFRMKRVPVVVVPSWFNSSQELIASGQYVRAGRLKAFIASKIVGPSVLACHQSQLLLPRPLSVLLLQKTLHYVPLNPWVLHSGFASAILVESRAHAQLAVDYGLDAQRLRVVGSVVLDRLGASSLSSMRERGRTQVLIAIPPDMTESRRDQLEGHDWDAIVIRLCSLAKLAPDIDFVAVYHPSELKRVTYIAGNLSFSDAPIEQILPEVDVFVASVSSTIAWALALGISVVNWDVYRYRYVDYLGSSALYSDRWDDLEALFSQALQLATETRHPDPDWGQIDGQGVERLILELRQLIDSGLDTDKSSRRALKKTV